MAENKKTPQNEKQAATTPADDLPAFGEIENDDESLGLDYDDSHKLYIDDDDNLYYIDDDGQRVDISSGIDVKVKLSDEQRERLRIVTKAMADTILKNKQITVMVQKAYNKLFTPEFKELLHSIKEDLQKSQEAASLIAEIDELQPYIETELKKDEYGGITLDDLLGDNLPDLYDRAAQEDSTIYKVLAAARAARATIEAQNAGRAERRQMKQQAAESGAIMEIKGGNYPVFSKAELWNAFAPGRICKMGTLNANFVDENTGRIKKLDFEPGEIEDLDALDIPAKALLLLNGIMKNSVDNIHTDFVKGGQITFYVKGVLQAVTDDPRSLLDDQQLNLERKTAGALYLENLFEPLQGYIGMTNDGSRWSVFNYIGYDANTDTMTVQTPYLYQLWRTTQQEYFSRQKNIAAAQQANKKPSKKDFTPLQINSLFKGKAYTENEITLEIAVYITNVLLNAGRSDKPKKTTIKYKTIIENCPKLKQRLDEIAARPNTEILPDGKKRNNTAIYNGELRKIKNAFTLIQNPDKCDALTMFEFIDIQPAKKSKKGLFELNTPTKSMINDKIVIEWRSKTTEQ